MNKVYTFKLCVLVYSKVFFQWKRSAEANIEMKYCCEGLQIAVKLDSFMSMAWMVKVNTGFL